MMKQEVLSEIINLIDDLDGRDAAGNPAHEPNLKERDETLTSSYDLCAAALD